MKKRRDLWAEPTTTDGSRTRTASGTPVRAAAYPKDPPVRVDITYASGRVCTLVKDEIDADNPVIRALVNIRTVRRFWRLNLAVDTLKYFTDEEILAEARAKGLETTDPVEAGVALNYIAKFFVTDERGEPAEDDSGRWIEATEADRGAYRPPDSPGDSTPPVT